VGSSDRLSSGLTDLLRGLLTDNEKSRWSLEEVLDWLDGRRMTVNQTIKVKKAARGIKFDNTNFFYANTLAHRMFRNPQEATELIDNNELTHWIERSLGNKEILARVDMAIRVTQEGGTGVGYTDRLLPRVSIALDPSAPIRFRSLCFHPNAIGQMMAEANFHKKGMNDFIELFNNGVIHFWITVCADLNMDVNEYVQQFDKVKTYLRQRGITDGIERCLYFLNPSIHCLSPLVEDYFVTDVSEYLLSLETIAADNKGSYSTRIIDKHAACFLMSRDQKLIEPYTFDLSSDLDYRYIMANLNILASIQRFNKVPPLPHLTNWICSLLTPVIARYHNTETQRSVQLKIEKNKDSGDLNKILKIINDADTIKKDQIEYKKAMRKYRELKIESDALEKKLENPKYFSQKTGREWAATIAAVVAALVILGFLMVHFGGETL
jgi:hypothetical protein